MRLWRESGEETSQLQVELALVDLANLLPNVHRTATKNTRKRCSSTKGKWSEGDESDDCRLTYEFEGLDASQRGRSGLGGSC